MDATTRRIARHVHGLTFAQLPPLAVHEARRRLIDSIACAAAASVEPFCRKLVSFAGRYTGTPSARLWGSGQSTSLEMAAFVNGALLRYLDYSDTVLAKSNGHPSDMVGALVAVGEAFDRDSADLLTAIVAAYEVYCGLCASVSLAGRGLDQGTAAAVGAAAGAAHLLKLSEEAMAHALSLALVDNLHLYNVRSGALSDWKGCGGPNGARNGVFAALLAREGVTGPSAPVEGKGGLWEVVGEFDWRVGQGALPLIAQTHLKLHPVCYHGQSAIDAALVLRDRVTSDEIETIEVDTYDAAFRAMGNDPQRWAPTNRETADHSLPYTVAVAWRQGRLRSDAYEDNRLRDEETLRLMQRVRVCASPEMTAAFPLQAQTRITVRTAAGDTFTHLQVNPKGHAQNPLSDAELEAKFFELAAPWGDRAWSRRVLDVLWTAAGETKARFIVDAVCSGG